MKKRPPKEKLSTKEQFLLSWRTFGLKGQHSTPSTEHVFSSQKNYRLDFAWPTLKLAVEIDGFGFGHQAIKQVIRDREKDNLAVELGWTVLRYTTADLSSRNKREAMIEQVVRVILRLTGESQ